MLLEISLTSLFKNSIKYVELITAVIGSIYYYKYKKSDFYKFFLVLIWYTAINDFLGLYLHRNSILRNNSILYNIFHLINFSTLFILFKSFVIKSIKYKKLINIFLVIFISVFLFNSILGFQNYFDIVIMAPFIVGAILLIIIILFYFLEILNTNKVLYISKNLVFWISVGLLLYYAGKIPIRIVRIHWESVKPATLDKIFAIEYFLSIVMNICFIIGFLCSQKVKK